MLTAGAIDIASVNIHRIVHHHHCPSDQPLLPLFLDVPFWRRLDWILSIII